MSRVDGVIAKTDSVMQGIDALAGGKDGGELFQAVKSFRELADNLDKRSATLILDGRRTLGDISRAVNNFDRNPTRVLFGPSNTAQQAPPDAARAEQPRPPRRRAQ